MTTGNGSACVTGGGGIPTPSSTTEAASVVTSVANPPAISQTLVVPNTDANNAPGGLAATYAAEGIELLDATNLAITKALTAPFTTGSSAPAIDAAFDVANSITFQRAGANTCLVILGAPTITITIQ